MDRPLRFLALVAAAIVCAAPPVHGFGGEDVRRGDPWHHEDITNRALAGEQPFYPGAGFQPAAAASVAWHADFIDSYLYNPIFWAEGGLGSNRLNAALVGFAELAKLHFDDTFSTAGLRANWQRYAAGTLAGLYWASLQEAGGDVAAGHHILGVSVHAVQDFYSHSSWVDDPARRCATWFQIEPEARNAMSLYSGAYELAASGAPKHHGAYSMSCSLLRGDTVDTVLDPVCGGYSPLQNTMICETFRQCSGASTVTVSVNDLAPESVVFLDPPGIALDTTWLSRIQAPNRGLVDAAGAFVPGMDGMHFRPGRCKGIVGAKRPDVCTSDADLVFAGAKDLAIRATTQWVVYIERAMTAMGAGPAAFWQRVKIEGSSQAARESQFEDFSKLPYQFLSAGPYPVANPSVPDRRIAASDSGWYLRLLIHTADRALAGTDADIYAEVTGPGFGPVRTRLDYLPTDDRTGRTDNRLLVYDDFQRDDDDVYTIGPFPDRPATLRLVNGSADAGDVLGAIWSDLTSSIEHTAADMRQALLSVVAGKADLVGTATVYLTSAELRARLEGRRQAFEETISINGGDEGAHDFTVLVRRMGPENLTVEEREQGWLAVEVAARRLKTVKESKSDRGSTSDEPFVVFLIAPLNGRADESRVFLSEPLVDMDSEDIHVFPRVAGSAHIIKMPPQAGGVVLALRVFEHDDESRRDRVQLRRNFESGLDEHTRRAAAQFLDAVGRMAGTDWTFDAVDAFAFRRSAVPAAGPVLTHREVREIKGGESSPALRLDWSRVATLLAPAQAIDGWMANPLGPEVLEGEWHAQGYACEQSVPYQVVDVVVGSSMVVAIKTDGDPCVPAGEVSWRGAFADGRISGTLRLTRTEQRPIRLELLACNLIGEVDPPRSPGLILTRVAPTEEEEDSVAPAAAGPSADDPDNPCTEMDEIIASTACRKYWESH